MHVLFVAAEVAPWMKVGGLGDVVGSLPPALRGVGVDARICVPAQAGVLDAAPSPKVVHRFDVPHRGGALPAQVWETRLGDVPAYLVGGPPIPAHGLIYTGRMDEEGHRFTFFSLAALELARRLEPRVDVLHCHDWHSSVAAWVLGRRRAEDPALRSMATVLTVHNLPYAGHGAEGALDAFGVPGTDDGRLPAHLRYVPLGLGLAGADALTTVSRGYAREILGAHHGHGFDELLRARRDDLTGILNGLDMVAWNPADDDALAAPFDADDRAGRAACREALAHELGLRTDLPIVGIVSRLVAQKGIDVAVGALRALPHGIAAAILGEGEPHLEYEARQLAHERPGQVSATIGFSAGLARRIYAGADMLLLPSRYEPCGMAQMIGMRYGCVPVACETGGLADTVHDVDLSDRPTGVVFPEATVPSARFALRRALKARERGSPWDRMIDHGMRSDFSWRASARDYVKTYERAAKAREGTNA